MRTKMLRTLLLSLALTAIFAASQVSAQYVYSNNNTQKNSTASLFVATDTKSDESGYGVSLTMKNDPTAALTYVHFEHFDVFQVSKSKSSQIGGYPVNIGLLIGYANNRVSNNILDTTSRPDGLLSGMEASVSLGKPSSSYSIELRASSLTENVDPIKWFSDPDLLWVGAGISFKY